MSAMLRPREVAWASLPVFNGLGRVLDLFEELDTAASAPVSNATWMRVTVQDEGTAYVVRAEVPGLSAKDVEVGLHGNVLTLRGNRENLATEGWALFRRERQTSEVIRTVRLPERVDGDGVTAVARDGVLIVTLPRAAELQPRSIPVHSIV